MASRVPDSFEFPTPNFQFPTTPKYQLSTKTTFGRWGVVGHWELGVGVARVRWARRRVWGNTRGGRMAAPICTGHHLNPRLSYQLARYTLPRSRWQIGRASCREREYSTENRTSFKLTTIEKLMPYYG